MGREPSIRVSIAEHARVAARPGDRAGRLLGDLSDVCWPGGVADRTEPLARSWLSLRGPELLVAEMPVCRCAEHCCQVCN